MSRDPLLFRCSFSYPSGELSRFTFASVPSDALRLAADLVKAYTKGELLALWEVRRLVVARPQLRLVP